MTPQFDQYAGQGGVWVAPIIMNCIAIGPDARCARQRYPTTMESVSGRVADAATLPVHPNYWGQRPLAACHSIIDQDPHYVGHIVRCSPAATGNDPVGLDSLGRPEMVVSAAAPL
jgi:hypothetical protein